jgi:all-trans-8'-apo-beta-carotenal 15,15'-oxygenase
MRSAVTREYTLPGFAFLHDFALTENYYVIFQNPVTVKNAPYMLGQAPAASCVRWVENTPTYVHVIPRNQAKNPAVNTSSSTDGRRSDDVMVFSAPPLFVFHHANAFERTTSTSRSTHSNTDSTTSTTTTLVIDSIHYDSLPAVGREALFQQAVDPDAAFTSRLRRVEIDLKSKILKVRCAFDGYLEMPAVNPNFFSKKHQFVYGYHSIFEDPQIALAKIDVEGRNVEVWSPGKNRFALEPRFIPRNRSRSTNRNRNKTSNANSAAGKAGGGGEGSTLAAFNNSNNNGGREGEVEDDGWLIAQLFDSEAMRSEIVILDAQNLRQGPIAIVALREPMPSALHACWSDTYYGPLDDDDDNDDTSDGSVSLLNESKTGNVVPFDPVLGTAEREKLKGSGSIRQSMPTGSSSSSKIRGKVVRAMNTTGLKEKLSSSKMQSVGLVLGALWANFTES